MRRGIPLVFAIVAAWGCSFVVDTDGLSGGSEPIDASDAADVVIDVRDAATDVVVEADAGCGTFCDSFDETPLGGLWTGQTMGQGASLAAGTPFLSAPNALHAKLENAPSTSDARAFLSKTFPVAHAFKCDVSMFIVKRTTNQLFSDIFRVRTKANDVNDYVLNLGFTGGLEGTFREDVHHIGSGQCECPRTEQGPPNIEAGHWVRVSLESDFTTATASFDGVREATLMLEKVVPTSELVVELGLQGYPNTEAEVLYDDLSCQTMP